MSIKTYFNRDIYNNIKNEIIAAEKHVFIAVAWMTDHYLFRILCEKAKSGIEIQIIINDDEINFNQEYSIDFSKIESFGGKVFVRTLKEGSGIMHSKFCLIDSTIIMTGSYNWTKQAREYNSESILIMKNEHLVFKQFDDEFERLLYSTTRHKDYKKNKNKKGRKL